MFQGRILSGYQENRDRDELTGGQTHNPKKHKTLCPPTSSMWGIMINNNKVIFELSNYEVLPGVMGNRGIMSCISGEQVNTSLNRKRTGKQM